MLQHLQGVWLLLLWLATGGRTLQFIAQREGCPTPGTACRSTCPVIRKWMNRVRNVDQGIETSDNKTILEGPQVLGKIKRTPEYGCILKQIFQFYAEVLALGGKGESNTDLSDLLGRLKRCLLKVHCPRLCKKINREAKKKTVKVDNVSDLSPRELAVFQIRKLHRAKRRLQANDVKTREKANVELKGLQFYDGNTNVTVTCPVNVW